jgi:hypothetical protein
MDIFRKLIKSIIKKMKRKHEKKTFTINRTFATKQNWIEKIYKYDNYRPNDMVDLSIKQRNIVKTFISEFLDENYQLVGEVSINSIKSMNLITDNILFHSPCEVQT